MIFHWRVRSARSLASVRDAAHSASRRSFRQEVGEPAVLGQLLDVGEGQRQALVRLVQADPAQPRRVDDHSAAGQEQQLPVHRGVPSAPVGLADPAGGHERAARQGVDQRRLAGPGPSEQHRGLAGAGPQRVQALPGGGGDRADLGAGGRARDQAEVDLGEVRLGDGDDGPRAGLPREGEQPFDPPEIGLRHGGLHHEDDVHVGGQHLAVRVPGAHPGPHEARPAGQDGPDGGVERDPVAHAGHRDRVAGDGAGERAAPREPVLAVLGEHVAEPAVDAGDPSGGASRLQGGGEGSVEAE